MPRVELRIEHDDDGLLLPAVQETLQALREDPAHKHSTDRAMARLAQTYAAKIDQYHIAAENARLLIEKAEDDEIEIAKRTLNAIMKFMESNQVLSDLGPRLQSVLESLGASPKARAQMTGSRGGGKPDDAGAGKPEESSLQRRRREEAERAQRARVNGAPPVDSSAS